MAFPAQVYQQETRAPCVLYCPWTRAILHPDSICASVPFCPQSLQFGSFLSPHVCRCNKSGNGVILGPQKKGNTVRPVLQLESCFACSLHPCYSTVRIVQSPSPFHPTQGFTRMSRSFRALTACSTAVVAVHVFLDLVVTPSLYQVSFKSLRPNKTLH